MIHTEELNNDGESKLDPVEMATSRHWIIHVHVFTINKGINWVHELIDVVQWKAVRRPLARRLRKFELQKPHSKSTVSPLGSVLGNLKPLFWRRRPMYDRNNGANELTPPHFPDNVDVADQ